MSLVNSNHIVIAFNQDLTTGTHFRKCVFSCKSLQKGQSQGELIFHSKERVRVRESIFCFV